MSLQADDQVAFEESKVIGECLRACHNSSLYPFILGIFLEAVFSNNVFNITGMANSVGPSHQDFICVCVFLCVRCPIIVRRNVIEHRVT